jgi:hypothetical protein
VGRVAAEIEGAALSFQLNVLWVTEAPPRFGENLAHIQQPSPSSPSFCLPETYHSLTITVRDERRRTCSGAAAAREAVIQITATIDIDCVILFSTQDCEVEIN